MKMSDPVGAGEDRIREVITLCHLLQRFDEWGEVDFSLMGIANLVERPDDKICEVAPCGARSGHASVWTRVEVCDSSGSARDHAPKAVVESELLGPLHTFRRGLVAASVKYHQKALHLVLKGVETLVEVCEAQQRVVRQVLTV